MANQGPETSVVMTTTILERFPQPQLPGSSKEKWTANKRSSNFRCLNIRKGVRFVLTFTALLLCARLCAPDGHVPSPRRARVKGAMGVEYVIFEHRSYSLNKF